MIRAAVWQWLLNGSGTEPTTNPCVSQAMAAIGFIIDIMMDKQILPDLGRVELIYWSMLILANKDQQFLSPPGYVM